MIPRARASPDVAAARASAGCAPWPHAPRCWPWRPWRAPSRSPAAAAATPPGPKRKWWSKDATRDRACGACAAAITRCGSSARSRRCRRKWSGSPMRCRRSSSRRRRWCRPGPAYGIGANPITALRVYIEWRRLQKPPDHLPLQPEPAAAAVCAGRARCGRATTRSDSKLEQMRPMLAARQLLTQVFDASGLALQQRGAADRCCSSRAPQGVRVHQDKLQIDDPVDVLKDVERDAARAARSPASMRW